MDMRVLAVIKNNLMGVIGYRILDVDTATIKDVVEVDILNVLSTGNINIEGIEKQGNSLVGNRGSLDRYATIISGKLKGKSPLLILNQIMKDETVVGYRVSDWKGNVINATLSDILKYANTNGIANGALKSLGDKQFISPIRGEYTRVNIGNTKENKKEDIEKTIWSAEEFIRYMERNKYRYTLERNDGRVDIKFDCPSATILKYPDTLDCIDGSIQTSLLSSVKTLIIPPSVKTISSFNLGKFPMLERLVIQEGAREVDYSGIASLDIYKSRLKEVVFPDELASLNGGFCGCLDTVSLDLSKTKLKRIAFSFNNLYKLENLILPEGIRVIRKSFSYCTSLKSITFPSSLVEISDSSFNCCNIETLDLSKCLKLRTIGPNVFYNCPSLKTVILPEGLETIGFGVLSSCANIENINIVKSITTIGERVLDNYKADSLTVGSNIKRIKICALQSVNTLKLDESFKVIPDKFAVDTRFKEVVLPGGLSEIGANSFGRCSFTRKIELPRSLERIGKGAFISCMRLEDLQFEELGRLKSLGDGAFRNCVSLSTVILPEGLTTIGVDCFRGCITMKSLLVPSTVTKIGAGALSFYAGGGDYTIYVFEGTEGLRYCKKNKLRHVIIKSYDDVYEYIGRRSIDSNKEAKLRMLLSTDDESRELLDDKYINYADKLYNLQCKLNSAFIPSTDNSRLDTSKFISIPVSEVEQVGKYMREVYWTKGQLEVNSETVLRDVFVTLSNYVTSLVNLNTSIITPSVMDYIRRKSPMISTTYKDNHSCIITLRITDEDDLDKGFRQSVVVIIMGNNIVFTGLVPTHDENPIDCLLRVNHTPKVDIKDTKQPISTMLSYGDLIKSSLIGVVTNPGWGGSIIDRATLTKRLDRQVTTNMNSSLVVLYKGMRSSTISVIPVIFLCLYTGKVIKAQCTGSCKETYHVNSMCVTSIQDFSTLDEKTKQLLKPKREREIIMANKFRYIALGDKYTAQLKSLDGAYDTSNSYEGDLGMILNKLDIKSVGEINLDIYTMLMETGFYREVKNRKLDVDKIVQSVEHTELEGGKYILTEYTLGKSLRSRSLYDGFGRYMVGIKSGGQDSSKLEKYYLSSDSIIKNIDILKSISMESKEPDILTNTDQGSLSEYTNSFTDIHNYKSTEIYKGKMYQFSLALSRSTGTAYLIGKVFDGLETLESTYKILRFKTLEDAIKQCKCLEVKDSCYVYIVSTLMSLGEGTLSKMKNNQIGRMRELIMGGIPNGHYIEMGYIDMFNSLAKQKEV